MDRPLTPAQSFYLEAFDVFLRAKTDRARAIARAAMSKRLNFVLAEAGLPLPGDTRWTDSMGRNRAGGARNPRRARLQRRRYHARKAA